ncbi:MAG TPA: Smr/MutS family protein [Turneriella sp.]|nr:Smr/MutS family protein [Turneriella sp.]
MPKLTEIYIRQMHFEDAKHKLLSEIEHLFFEGVCEVEIIHGIGNYILRKMVIAELSKLDYVHLDENHFNPNPGSLRATLLVPDENLLERYKG